MNHAVLIAKLRWTLFKNSLRRRANLFEFIMAALAFGAFSLFDVGVSVGLGALTTVTYHHDFFAPLFAVVLGGILIVWQLMPLFTASFGSDLNISRFRIYPLTTRSLFFIDLMLGFFDPVALLATILVAGVFAGVVVASPRSAPVAGLGLLLFVLFNIGLARYIQRLLASLFASRRRKELLALFIFLLLLAPQTLIMMQRRPIERGGGPRDTTGVRYVRLQEAEQEQRVRDLRAAGEAIRWTPPGLAAAMLNPAGLDAATQFLLLLAGFIFAAAVFGLKYRQLTRDYLGHESGFSRRKKRRSDLTRESARRSTSLTNTQSADRRSIPQSLAEFVERLTSPVSAAVFEKDVRYIYRSPRALLIAIAPVAGSVIFILPGSPFARTTFAGQYRLAGILLYAIIVSFQLLSNSFAFDWHGAKLYFVSPASGESILIGKNLAALSSVTVQMLIITFAFSLLSGPPSLVAMINALFVLLIGLPITMVIGNYLSVLYPRGIDFSKIYGKSYSGVSAAVGFAVLPGLLVVLSIGPVLGWLLHSDVVPYAVFVAEAIVALASYVVLIKSAGRLLEGRAEQFLQGLFTTR